MALVYFDRKPTLRYNFSAGEPLKGEGQAHCIKGKGKMHRVSKDILTGTIRALDKSMPITHCQTAHS
jgi:hypothetical protein